MGRVSHPLFARPIGRVFKMCVLVPTKPHFVTLQLRRGTAGYRYAPFYSNPCQHASSLVSSHHSHNLMGIRSEILQLELILPGFLVPLQIDLVGSNEGAASFLAAGLKNDLHQCERVILNAATAAKFGKCL